MWKRFGFEPYQEACAARLLPGDGIARRVMVQMFDELDGRAAPKKSAARQRPCGTRAAVGVADYG